MTDEENYTTCVTSASKPETPTVRQSIGSTNFK